MTKTTLSAALLSLAAITFSQTPSSQHPTAAKLLGDANLKKQEALTLARAKGFAARRQLPNGTVFELMRLRNGRPAFFQTLGLDSADTISADELWPGGSSGLGLTGSGITLGEWDAGRADASHRKWVRITAGKR